MMDNQLMEALVLHAVGDLRLEQIPIPSVSEGQVRVQNRFLWCMWFRHSTDIL